MAPIAKMQIDTSKPDPLVMDCIIQSYTEVLKVKADKMKAEKRKTLLQLDKWYHKELAVSIQGRKEKHITKAELCQLMTWKLTRGKFRPRLTELVRTNCEEDVIEASKRAFAQLPDLATSIKSLSELKAVGPATASAVLAAGSPRLVAFMSDEAMQCFSDLKPIQYTLNFYLQYMEHINKLSKTLRKHDHEWTPHKVELALWTWKTSQILGIEILHDKPIYSNLKSMDDEEVEKKKLPAKRKRQTED